MIREVQHPAKTETLWDADQVCEYLRISRRTLTNLIKRGMPAISIGRRILRFHPDAVRRWAAGCGHNP
jgi:excisionase family DNA binding protein